MRLRALTTTVEVTIDDDVALRELAVAIGQLHAPAHEPADVHFHLRRSSLQYDDREIEAAEPRDVVPRFELELYDAAVTHAPAGWLLHAAALDVGGRALVLCGRSGAGKTTTTLELVRRGYPMLSEELVWLGPDGLVHGLRRPLHRKPDDELPVPASWPVYEYELRMRSGALETQTITLPPQNVFAARPLPLHTIVRLGHGSDWPAYLRESPPATALQRLWGQTLRHDEADLTVATALLHDRVTYELSSRTLDQALSLLEGILK